MWLRAKIRPLPPMGLTLPSGEGPTPRSLTPVTGWVLGEVDHVDVTIDGAFAARARTGLRSRELAMGHRDPSAATAGFEALVGLWDLPTTTSEIELEVTATFADGTSTLIGERRLDLAAPDPTPDPAPPALTPGARAAGGAIRLLVLTHDLGLGGGQLYLQELLVRLLATGRFHATLISPRDGVLRPELEALGVEVRIRRQAPLGDPGAYESSVESLAAQLRSGGYDVALANTMGALDGVDATTRAGIPVAWAIHESFALEEFWWRAYGAGVAHGHVKARGRQALGRASALIFEADETRLMYEPYSDPSRCRTVPYGIDLARIDGFRSQTTRQDSRDKLGISADTRLILCVGTVESRKAQVPLVKAFARVADRFPRAQLALVGDLACDYSEGLHAYVRDNRLESRVRIVPVTPDVHSWLNASDLFAISSDVESLPRSILEAMAFGLPVLASGVFGVKDLIDDGSTGILVPPLDIGALASVLERVLAMNDAQLREIGGAGERLVRERHDAGGYAAAYSELLAELAGSGS
jgi:glycosyltransferase involved in cell wall biosynthesis